MVQKDFEQCLEKLQYVCLTKHTYAAPRWASPSSGRWRLWQTCSEASSPPPADNAAADADADADVAADADADAAADAAADNAAADADAADLEADADRCSSIKSLCIIVPILTQSCKLLHNYDKRKSTFFHYQNQNDMKCMINVIHFGEKEPQKQ